MPPGGAPGGMPPGMPAGPQPGMAMPPGMEGAPPFSQGGEVAPQGFAQGGMVSHPPTPDGMPPIHAAAGAFIAPATRAAQFLSDKAGSLNAALGRMYMSPTMTQPYLENVRGPGGKFTAEQVARGGDLLYPTLTQGLAQNVSRLAEQYPRLSRFLPAGMLGAGAASEAMRPGPSGGQMSDLVNQIPIDTREDILRRAAEPTPATSIDISSPDASKWTMQRPGQPPTGLPYSMQPEEVEAENRRLLARFPTPVAEEAAAPAATGDDLGAFIQARLKDQEARDAARVKTGVKEAAKTLTKGERIKAGMAEYEPMFREILGEDKEAAKTNALLLLAEAGFKLAGTRKPTMAMAVGEAFAGLPRGLAAIAAQERELGAKVRSAALQQAISDVESQDKFAQALQLEALKGDFAILREQAKKGGNKIEDGGGGLRVVTSSSGSFIGTGIDPEDPTVKTAVNSRFTLRDTNNPFVENRGPAPTTIETDRSERTKLLSTLRSLDNSLSTLDNLKGVYANAYGPNAWFQDKVNNLLVPVLPSAVVRPNFDVADASTRITTGMNSILKNIASANDGGRVAVQEQEWARETARGISDPVKFFADKELAAKQFNSFEAMLRNARQQVLTQLGYETNDFVMRAPNTGTKSDPFVIPSDPNAQKTMYNFLGSSIGKVQDPQALVYLRMPNGRIDAFSPTQLRSLSQQ